MNWAVSSQRMFASNSVHSILCWKQLCAVDVIVHRFNWRFVVVRVHEKPLDSQHCLCFEIILCFLFFFFFGLNKQGETVVEWTIWWSKVLPTCLLDFDFKYPHFDQFYLKYPQSSAVMTISKNKHLFCTLFECYIFLNIKPFVYCLMFLNDVLNGCILS